MALLEPQQPAIIGQFESAVFGALELDRQKAGEDVNLNSCLQQIAEECALELCLSQYLAHSRVRH
jgi:hypothetical protein